MWARVRPCSAAIRMPRGRRLRSGAPGAAKSSGAAAREARSLDLTQALQPAPFGGGAPPCSGAGCKTF
jgi:hypothetical protein